MLKVKEWKNTMENINQKEWIKQEEKWVQKDLCRTNVGARETWVQCHGLLIGFPYNCSNFQKHP